MVRERITTTIIKPNDEDRFMALVISDKVPKMEVAALLADNMPYLLNPYSSIIAEIVFDRILFSMPMDFGTLMLLAEKYWEWKVCMGRVNSENGFMFMWHLIKLSLESDKIEAEYDCQRARQRLFSCLQERLRRQYEAEQNKKGGFSNEAA